MTIRFPVIATGALMALALAGCADQSAMFGGSNLTTSSVSPTTPVADPACSALAQQISTLRSEGVAEKIEKAAAKKYKMSPADLTKADQLTKASADFQGKCGTVPMPAVQQAAAQPAAAAAVKPAAKTAAAKKPAEAPAAQQ